MTADVPRARWLKLVGPIFGKRAITRELLEEVVGRPMSVSLADDRDRGGTARSARTMFPHVGYEAGLGG